TINDSLGHTAGDTLLREVAERLRSCLRKSDIVARQGGDEFIIILPDIRESYSPHVIAEKILNVMQAPFRYDEHEFYVSFSIGIAVYPDNGTDAEQLLIHADQAMYAVKNRGRSGYRYYSSALNLQSEERLRLEGQLHHALDENQLEVYYQPRYLLSGNRLTGLEALLRWRHPELGLILPEEFISLAEETGLIVPIGEWVLRRVCRDIHVLRTEIESVPVVSVNYSPRQFQKSGIVGQISDILKEENISAEALELEITEGSLMPEPESARQLLKRLRKLGVGISLDDFGVGFSSFSSLKTLPVQTIKIDRSIVKALPGSDRDAAIVHAILALGHGMNLKVIAEGVEREDQKHFLMEAGCLKAQGNLFCEPLPRADLIAFLKSN
ncbi:MAG: bifunctional diguanylate cyclase/phosphodiesterase, partial [Leptospiraceae bacterium]|nr:bifunctional diguanylate cyclase/phosphodiesterase [Leptospiraceae bacterium]